MDEEIFRKKSLAKIKSPENLDEYIRVANPGVWLALIAVIVLLLGGCVWGFCGRIETTVELKLTVQDGSATGVLPAESMEISPGMPVSLGEYEGTVTTVDLLTGTVTVSAEVPDGNYEASICTESLRPLSFVFD